MTRTLVTELQRALPRATDSRENSQMTARVFCTAPRQAPLLRAATERRRLVIAFGDEDVAYLSVLFL